MEILMVKEVWSNRYQSLKIILWLSISIEVRWRNMRSMTKFESLALSE